MAAARGWSTATAAAAAANHRVAVVMVAARPGGDLTQALVGNWQCQVMTATGPSDRERQFLLANGEFHGQFGLGERLDDERLGHLAAGRL